MQRPTITEYTNVHVDDCLANNVSIKTHVNVYASNGNACKNSKALSDQRQHQAIPVEKDFEQMNENIPTDNIVASQNINVGTKESKQMDTNEVNNEEAKQVSGLENDSSAKQNVEVKKSVLEENIAGNGDTTKSKLATEAANEINSQVTKTVNVSNNAIELANGKGIIRIEKHKVHIMEHTLVVSGVHVSEKKEKTTVIQEDINGNVIGNGEPIKTIIVHSRTIGDRKYAMKEVKDIDGETTDTQVITEIPDEEIKKFEEDWKDYWIPTITDEQIESGEFEKELKELELKQCDEDVKVTLAEVTDDNEIKGQEEKVEVESVPKVSEAIYKSASSIFENESSIVQEHEVEVGSLVEHVMVEEIGTNESLVEVFVKNHPLKVFYFGVLMLVIAILVFQCCFLPEYPPCSWFKCILECIQKANDGEF